MATDPAQEPRPHPDHHGPFQTPVEVPVLEPGDETPAEGPYIRYLENGWVETRHYRGPDRRVRPTPRLSRFTFFGGRRRGARRDGEDEGTFVDQYSLRMWIILAWIGVMNSGDSFFTLMHLQSGGIELNPVAAYLLRTGRVGFVAWKSLLITVPLLILCLHKNFPLARLGLWAAAGMYTVLIAYHISLF